MTGARVALVGEPPEQHDASELLHESRWLSAWRYANHFRAALDGDVYTVTPHGWGGYLDYRAGYEPRLEAA